jgi:hypothetical protein
MSDSQTPVTTIAQTRVSGGVATLYLPAPLPAPPKK